MAQMTEHHARCMLAYCDRLQHPPLTVWETKQLLLSWLKHNAAQEPRDPVARAFAGLPDDAKRNLLGHDAPRDAAPATERKPGAIKRTRSTRPECAGCGYARCIRGPDCC